ncbi:hypothetical protein JD292_01645 [Leucobacter sp. CSA2]|uniref:Lipoprotein n=1 Tax=Leucobacter edaphi TaxID=2796472 RepID=A0A934UWQ7_9MICO|nr:hypothetical protein [Leucobacter edaphi]MBK0420786.1 hypothetical protein [Leucobacter edaphi]
MKSVRRIGAVLATFGLAAALVSCSGGQSVADACKITNDQMESVVTKSQSNVNAELQKATQGEDADIKGAFEPVTKAIKDAQTKVTNEEVKKPLDTFAKEYNSFIDSVEGVDFKQFADLKNLDPTDPNAMEKAKAVQETAQKLQKDMTDHATKIQDAGNKLTEVCKTK